MSQDKVDIREALNERDGFQVWWRLFRPHTLTAAFIPVFVGTMFAYFHDNVFKADLFIVMLLACLLIQIAVNMFNEYYDYVRGLDTEKSVGIGGTIVRDGVAPKTVLRLGFIFFGVAILLGVYICMQTSWWIAVIGLASMLIGYLYTGGPIPIAYTPFGELTSGLLMGTVIMAITYYIQTFTVTKEIIFISLPVALFIGAIMLSNNIRDLDGDKESGRKTIAILLGRPNAIKFLASMFIAAFVITGVLIIVGILPIWSLIAFLGVKKATEAVTGFIGKSKPLEMMPAMVATGKTNTIYGVLLGLSLLISSFL